MRANVPQNRRYNERRLVDGAGGSFIDGVSRIQARHGQKISAHGVATNRTDRVSPKNLISFRRRRRRRRFPSLRATVCWLGLQQKKKKRKKTNKQKTGIIELVDNGVGFKKLEHEAQEEEEVAAVGESSFGGCSKLLSSFICLWFFLPVSREKKHAREEEEGARAAMASLRFRLQDSKWFVLGRGGDDDDGGGGGRRRCRRRHRERPPRFAGGPAQLLGRHLTSHLPTLFRQRGDHETTRVRQVSFRFTASHLFNCAVVFGWVSSTVFPMQAISCSLIKRALGN